MTLDEAIKRCEEAAELQEANSLIDRWGGDYEYSESVKENCRQCAADHRQLAEWLTELKQFKAAGAQPINRWIKADESLPVYGGMVLICDKSKNIRLGIYTDMGWCSQFGNPMMCKITHWQPLPEPPKE